MASKRDVTVDVLLARNQALADRLQQMTMQRDAAVSDNKRLRTRIAMKVLFGGQGERHKTA